MSINLFATDVESTGAVAAHTDPTDRMIDVEIRTLGLIVCVVSVFARVVRRNELLSPMQDGLPTEDL